MKSAKKREITQCFHVLSLSLIYQLNAFTLFYLCELNLRYAEELIAGKGSTRGIDTTEQYLVLVEDNLLAVLAPCTLDRG